MDSPASPEMEILKSRLKGIWEAGDYAELAKHLQREADAFVDRLELRSSEHVLDVACGSGNLAIPAARAGADVTGVDIAGNLLETAKQRAASEGLDVKFEQGDAENMPYDDESFDTVVSMFGAMFAPRPDVVAGELLRVTRPGGRIAMANWTPEGFAGEFFKLAAKYVPPPPNMAPPVEWGVEQIVRERLGYGTSSITFARRMCRFEFEMPPGEVVQFYITNFGPSKTTYESLESDKQEAYATDLEALLIKNNLVTDGNVTMDGEYLEVIAVKSERS